MFYILPCAAAPLLSTTSCSAVFIQEFLFFRMCPSSYCLSLMKFVTLRIWSLRPFSVWCSRYNHRKPIRNHPSPCEKLHAHPPPKKPGMPNHIKENPQRGEKKKGIRQLYTSCHQIRQYRQPPPPTQNPTVRAKDSRKWTRPLHHLTSTQPYPPY